MVNIACTSACFLNDRLNDLSPTAMLGTASGDLVFLSAVANGSFKIFFDSPLTDHGQPAAVVGESPAVRALCLFSRDRVPSCHSAIHMLEKKPGADAVRALIVRNNSSNRSGRWYLANVRRIVDAKKHNYAVSIVQEADIIGLTRVRVHVTQMRNGAQIIGLEDNRAQSVLHIFRYTANKEASAAGLVVGRRLTPLAGRYLACAQHKCISSIVTRNVLGAGVLREHLVFAAVEQPGGMQAFPKDELPSRLSNGRVTAFGIPIQNAGASAAPPTRFAFFAERLDGQHFEGHLVLWFGKYPCLVPEGQESMPRLFYNDA